MCLGLPAPGGGTSVISRAPLASGVPADRVTVMEVMPSMADCLCATLPGVDVIAGNAHALPDLLPRA